MDYEWKNIGLLAAIPRQGARRLCFGQGGRPIAVFRTAEDELFALIDECPHRQGPLSEGIIAGKTVTCPLHSWVIDLADGAAQSPDKGNTPSLPVKLVNGEVFVGLTAKVMV